MHGLGNDFIVLDGFRQTLSLTTEQYRFLANRHFGVGCDQILLVEKACQPGVDFRYRIFNADGLEVEQCGNGARCFARFVHEQGLSSKREIRVETRCGIISPRLEDNGLVTVDMGAPCFAPDKIPFVGASEEKLTYSLLLPDGQKVLISAVSMGNPHAVQVVENTEQALVALQGPQIESHPHFPQRVNVGFMQIVDAHHIRLRVYERGSGETLACGTGACAAVVTGIRRGLLHSPVEVSTHGGKLHIVWAGEGDSVLMTGPAVTVFSGEIAL